MEWMFVAFTLTGVAILFTMQRLAKNKQFRPHLKVVEPERIEPIVLPDAYKVNDNLSQNGSTIRVVACESRLSRKLSGKLK
ncbi:hypothetical protein [Vibrio tapetis]|uniref:Uncharacterized protein n=1 Tax=Vibrio tapetis subsp. tapetis TaxID=1671868 RepID=A0A2N8Z9C6_9VIBR|nr:hypothetical protein [Vibrio tapetis]SON48518.1 exported protein of unknown function [Vibrio tapetis subsp. tapetis]